MTFNLFIDDERSPSDVTWAPQQVSEKYRNEEWVVARNGQQVLDVFIKKGMPEFISFDHDLGDYSGTGYDITKMLINIAIETPIPFYQFPSNFQFFVHSKNPIGKANIEGLLNNYLEVRNANRL
jgi:hypothetical protein